MKKRRVAPTQIESMRINAIAKSLDAALHDPPKGGEVILVDKSEYQPVQMDKAKARRGWVLMRIRRIPQNKRGWLQSLLIGYAFRPMEMSDETVEKAIKMIEAIEAGEKVMKNKKVNRLGGQK